MQYAALDFETASSSTVGRICSVGVVHFDETGLGDEFYSLSQPGCTMDPFCQSIHGITDEMVETAPTLFDVLCELGPWLEGRTVVAHCAGFDIKQMHAAAQREGVGLPDIDFYCTHSVSRRAFPGRSSYKLSNLVDIFGFTYDAHNALEDARACGELFRRCAQTVDWQIEERLGVYHGYLRGNRYLSCKSRRQKAQAAR